MPAQGRSAALATSGFSETASSKSRLSREFSPSVRLYIARLAYGGIPLFEHLELILAAGETTCLLGPSGVGKSTILRLLAGLQPLADGDRIEVGDDGILTGRVAYLEQRGLLLPWLTVLENVLLGARLRGEVRDTDRARELLRRVGLLEQAECMPSTLSGGMQQRVALARTLMEDRPVILMDEPFSALDAVTRYQLQALTVGLFRSRTVLLVTHDPAEAVRLGHRILILKGRPARLTPLQCPADTPPRDPTLPAELECGKSLMRELGMVQSGC